MISARTVAVPAKQVWDESGMVAAGGTLVLVSGNGTHVLFLLVIRSRGTALDVYTFCWEESRNCGGVGNGRGMRWRRW